jgi:hypothetical protein
MSLVKATIKTAIINVISQPFDNTTNATVLRDQYADAFADALIDAIESLRITIPSSAIVVTGSATTQTNAAPIVLDSAVS